jgi:hypothetical protein
MAIIDVELPLLILVAALVCALLAWILGTFTPFLRNYRYRVALGLAIFPLSGMMGFLCTLKLEMSVMSDWLFGHPVSWLLGIAYFGYFLFGFLGCWTAVRLGGSLDRRRTLSDLYSLLEERKKQDANYR